MKVLDRAGIKLCQLCCAARYINQVNNHKVVRSLCVFLDVCEYVGEESVHVCLFRLFSFEKGQDKT